jgi:hypothetical protein
MNERERIKRWIERALENVKKADDIKLNANDQYEYVEPASAA